MLDEERRQLELQVRVLKQELWAGSRSGLRPARPSSRSCFAIRRGRPPSPPATPKRPATAASRIPKGPKPLDPALAREVIALTAPEMQALMCPETKRPRQPGFVLRRYFFKAWPGSRDLRYKR